MKFAPGEGSPRHEDGRLLTGKGRYADDVTLPGLAHAVFVRAPVAHAQALSLNVEAAAAAPGVLAVLTGADWAEEGLGGLTGPGHMLPRPPRRPGGVFENPARPGLPADKILFLGEAVVMVVAETKAEAMDAAELVEIDFEELPPLMTIDAALAEGAPAIRADFPGNIAFEEDWGDAAATEAALAAAPHVLRERFVISRVYAHTMEPRAITADWSGADGRCTIWAGVHRPYAARDMLCRDVFGVDPSLMDVVAGDLGGSFGVRGGNPVEMALVAWASRRTGRPVKWLSTRSEMLLADDHSRDMDAEAELGVDDEGRMLALRVRTRNNIGAHAGQYGLAPSTQNIGGHVGPYTIPVAHVRAMGAFSNAAPNAPYRGAGRPEATYVIERMATMAATRLGIDPAELRRRNLIPPEALPYRSALTFTYDSGEFEAVLDKALAGADVAGFPARRAASEAAGRLRGLGLAFSIESAGAPGFEIVDLEFQPGGRLVVQAGTSNHGQGHETVLVQYLTDRLGIAAEDITVFESDTRTGRGGNGTGGSRSAAFLAASVLKAIDGAVEAARPVAAHLLQAAPEEVLFESGAFTAGARSVPFAEVARAAHDPASQPGGRAPGLAAEGTGEIGDRNFPNGCQVVELEIDPETGEIEIASHLICDDVGFEINPTLVKGQLQGGAAQGIGQALMERLVYDEAGQLLTGSFMDYAMPRAEDLPNFTTLSHPVPTATNPAGVKGVGESGTVGALPAFMNAVNDALATAGAGPVEMPASPFRVWQALAATKG